MSRTFDVNGSGEQPPAGPDFDAGTGLGGDQSAIGDAFGSTNFGDGPADPRGGEFVFDPKRHISIDRRNADGTYRRKRQRRGSGGSSPASKRPKADLQASIDGLSKILLVMHIGLAEISKTPELVLQPTEGDALASSLANVGDQFDITPDPKVQAIIGLMMTAGMIYGSRMYNIRERLKNTDKPKGTVHHLRPVDNNAQSYAATDETTIVN